jgi:glucose-6-phosphate 1-dehydrogenase
MGATGDLARRKLFPALFACFDGGALPPDVQFVGLGRTAWDDAAFRGVLSGCLRRGESPSEETSRRIGAFLGRCRYRRVDYASSADFSACDAWLTDLEGGRRANRLLYFAVPPFVFGDLLRALAQSGLLPGPETGPWTRVVIEKPFGRDRASYDELQRTLAGICREPQVFRIDHYLGKEVVQNLLVLRFANPAFESIWSCAQIHHVHIAWSETRGVAGRASYFDHYGIIRDVMQNHLMQILALVAMERPERLDAVAVQDAKAGVLRRVAPVEMKDLVIGQYMANPLGPEGKGYLQEEGVPPDSVTATYAAAVLRVDTARWRGVPFLMTAGKGLRRSVTEVRLHFRESAHGLFTGVDSGLLPESAANELILRVQPDERLAMRIVSKIPGAGMRLGTTELDLRFRERYPGVRIADAYENLLLDAIRGDRGLFLRGDELEAAWDAFTPVLLELESGRKRPEPYALGGCGPASIDPLAARYDIADGRVIDQACGG